MTKRNTVSLVAEKTSQLEKTGGATETETTGRMRGGQRGIIIGTGTIIEIEIGTIIATEVNAETAATVENVVTVENVETVETVESALTTMTTAEMTVTEDTEKLAEDPATAALAPDHTASPPRG